jgi:hypothetical protein
MNQATHPTNRFDPLAGDTAGEQGPAACPSRPGYAMAEAILAFAILGTALAGLAPFAMTHLRLIHKLETRFQGNPVTRNGQSFLPNQANAAQTYYCVPWKNPRMRSLFGRATVTIDQSNAVDDYNNSSSGTKTNALTIFYATSNTPPPMIYYSQTLTYNDFTSDPLQFTIYLDVVPKQ